MATRRAVCSTSSLTAPLRLRLQLRLSSPPSPASFSTISSVGSLLNQKSSDYLCAVRRLFALATSKTLTSFGVDQRNNHVYNFSPFVSQCDSYGSSSSPRVVEVDEQPSGSGIGNGNRAYLEDDAKQSIPVRAFFFSTSVDLKSLVEQNKYYVIPSTSRMTNYVVFKFGEAKSGSNGIAASLGESECTYMVVYQYGSIVLFNAPNHKVNEYLKVVKDHASGWLSEMRKDEYEVKEKPTLDTWMQGGPDYILLQHLDVDGIRTIGSVLGQSIALDYYVRQVDGMVAEFTDINREMENSGTFKMKRKKLFQLVGKANSNLADVILKLGLFERSDIAWKDAKYAQIWEYLRDEFELTPRFASLDFKLKFVEHNIHFLQEILQNRRSHFLEVVIVILISVEIIISLYEVLHKSVSGALLKLGIYPTQEETTNHSELTLLQSNSQLSTSENPLVPSVASMKNPPELTVATMEKPPELSVNPTD